ncbi:MULTISPECIES: ATP-binding protein [Bacillus]|uniref:histidine kinase n=1 Tax=Bacillus pseudomycoides TaxID=64104 RepID=A0A1Y3MC01_9BACI|nr:hypothetical protein KOY_00124 [Bacillus cereus VDM021]OUM47987.1 hypothetical protein BW425_14880 [Bacillus pseudomycoides]
MRYTLKDLININEFKNITEQFYNLTKVPYCLLDNNQNVIFSKGEPFYSTKEKGTGVGLMISYQISESHGGKINIRSQVGKGTTVIVFLPIYNNTVVDFS